jgi:hypothetical protein
MKIINKILTVFFMSFGILNAFAAPAEPLPAPTAKAAAGGVPGPPAPIDGIGLLILVFAAILLGIYVIYKHKLKTKASV